MANQNLLSAAANLQRAAIDKINEQKQLLADSTHMHRQLGDEKLNKEIEHRQWIVRKQSQDKNEAMEAEKRARELQIEIDQLKAKDSQLMVEHKQAADRLAAEAAQLEAEAKNLQAQA